uniref:VWFA domain-containing protein n=1 Tax=Mola mola TaxID=94237 RepID=A0A3Q3W9S6_MOLML
MRHPLLLLLGLLLLQQGRCFVEFVIESEWEKETVSQNPKTLAIRGDHITVKSYKVESRITSRFAHTTVRSSVVNSGSKAQTIGFNVQIPKRAFISNFTIFSWWPEGRRQASSGTGSMFLLCRANAQDMETFKTEVHVPPGSHIEFELHYQEMMQRKLGMYEHTLYLQPGRLVPHLQVDVYIFEPKGISMIQSPNTLGNQFADLIHVTTSKGKAHVVFKPTYLQQRKCENCSETAVDGIFTVQYDVTRDNNAGELQVSDGHFVQFFAPSNLSPLPKNIVFVIDVSGSMWGIKMKQTVEAMQAILDDLTIDDNFSIVDFNHNVRCWNEELVAASYIQISDAKKYIQNIKPNGGTNINEALLRAVNMLLRATNQGLINPRSVSMIILVSDGDPTVGEIKLTTIQKNVKRVMREEFSLFSLGIGFDVDYDFLERIATENRGVAHRIYSNHNAAEQLRMFYRQVSSPLLRRIAIQFPEDTVSDVTQNSFDKYFSGSELVVAGKVQPSESTTLTSFITASAARLDIALQTEADITELDTELAKQEHSFTGFARQMWAYITIKQLISERSLAPTAVKKRKITQQIMLLALDHQFVTPLTALLVESEDASERLLADHPKDPRHACCPVTPVQLKYQPPPWVHMTTPAPPSPVKKVDNDPHFIVHLSRSNFDVCFNIDSKPGQILNLVSDSGTGLVVNGQLIRSKRMNKGKVNTYFGTISVYYQPDGISLTISPASISMDDGKNNNTFTWATHNSHISITINNNIHMMVLLHRVWKKNPVSVDFLGIYIANDNQYSPLVHGLIGQFSREPDVSVYDVHEGADPLKEEATMEVKGNRLQVTRGWQKDYRRDRTNGSNIYCWFVHNSGKGFIDGHYTDYIVPQLNSFLPTTHSNV